jgi:6-pyruvoyltetrahydropterin/6-carboxytetrahydropterin synthase
MYEIGVVTQFEAAHRLVGDFGPATRLHGHTYRVEAAVRGEQLKADGTLVDITVVQGALQEATAALHYRNLEEVAALAGINTTAEAVARHLYDQVAPRLRGLGLQSLSVRVWESPAAYAAYEGAPDGS